VLTDDEPGLWVLEWDGEGTGDVKIVAKWLGKGDDAMEDLVGLEGCSLLRRTILICNLRRDNVRHARWAVTPHTLVIRKQMFGSDYLVLSKTGARCQT
jgi:hypothetical protein